MLLGSLFGILSGLSLPLVILVYGYAMDDFASYDILETLQKANYSIASATENASSFYFCTPSEFILDRYLDSPDTIDTLKTETQHYTYFTLGLAIMVFISSSLSRLLWAITGSRQAQQMRLTFFTTVLTRQIGWYDNNSIAEMPSHLSKLVALIARHCMYYYNSITL